MTIERLFWFLAAFTVATAATGLCLVLAKRWGIVDQPGGRKVHAKPMPLLGGVAIFVSIALCTDITLFSSHTLTSGIISGWQYAGFILGGLVLIIGGALDDKFNLPPKFSIIPPILASLIAIGFGVEVSKLTNPLGGVFLVPHWASNIIVFVWLLIVMETTKLLDGLDGLATGVAAVGTVMVMLLSLTAAYFQPDVALLACIVFGAMLGFLMWNFHPAKIFLGEGGSTFVGYSLGILAVISGGKLAIALLAVGIPLMDVVWSVVRRVRAGGWKAAFKGDKQHLHHRLLDLGWSQRRIVVSYYVVAALFGFSALFLQSKQKLFALGVLVLLMIIIIAWLIRYEHIASRPAKS